MPLVLALTDSQTFGQVLNSLAKFEQDIKRKWTNHDWSSFPFCFLQAAVSGRPGASYVDLPSNILMGPINQEQAQSSLQIPALGPNRLLRERPHADGAAVAQAAQLLANAQR